MTVEWSSLRLRWIIIYADIRMRQIILQCVKYWQRNLWSYRKREYSITSSTMEIVADKLKYNSVNTTQEVLIVRPVNFTFSFVTVGHWNDSKTFFDCFVDHSPVFECAHSDRKQPNEQLDYEERARVPNKLCPSMCSETMSAMESPTMQMECRNPSSICSHCKVVASSDCCRCTRPKSSEFLFSFVPNRKLNLLPWLMPNNGTFIPFFFCWWQILSGTSMLMHNKTRRIFIRIAGHHHMLFKLTDWIEMAVTQTVNVLSCHDNLPPQCKYVPAVARSDAH